MKKLTTLKSENLEHLAQVLKAVAHPLRLRLLDLLCRSEHTVNELTAHLGIAQALVSQQLKTMRSAGILAVRQDGARRIYSLALSQLRHLIECMASCQDHCRPAVKSSRRS